MQKIYFFFNPIFQGGRPYKKKRIFGQNLFARVLGKNKTFVKLLFLFFLVHRVYLWQKKKYKMSQDHEILALGFNLANLKHDDFQNF